jgi:hypothetical protein
MVAPQVKNLSETNVLRDGGEAIERHWGELPSAGRKSQKQDAS